MKLLHMGVVVGLFLVVRMVAAEPPRIPQKTPKIHRTACELAESMASKFPSKKMTQEQAQHTCEQLVPTMNAEGHAQFMRCCQARLLKP